MTSLSDVISIGVISQKNDVLKNTFTSYQMVGYVRRLLLFMKMIYVV